MARRAAPDGTRTDHTTLNIRAIPVASARMLKGAAVARGYTLPEYLHRLALLHEAVRELAESEPRAAQILETLGLQTVMT